MRKEVIAHKDPKSPISEVFRSLRTNIQFMSSSKGLKTILVTSTVQGEGKSWVVANLAVTFAQAGKRVIIVDADMRRARQYNIFSVAPMPGLSNYLSGIDENGLNAEDNILTYIKRTEIDNLYIMPAGNVPPNPSELLISNKMVEMIKRLKELCDVIIFDGTPSILVTDSVIMSRIVDTTLIVTSHKLTKIEDLKKVKKAIENVGGNIGGVIINRIPVSNKSIETRYYYSSNNVKTLNENMGINLDNKHIRADVEEDDSEKPVVKAEGKRKSSKGKLQEPQMPIEREDMRVEKTDEILDQMKNYVSYKKR